MKQINISFSTLHAKWPYKRQTPQESMTWKNAAFTFNTSADDADFIVVYDEPHKTLQTRIPKTRRILFISEPPSIKKYETDYLEQFGIIFTPQKIEGLPPEITQIISQLALPWHYGVAHSSRFKGYKTYDDLKSMSPPNKKREISTMISSKTMNARHRQRIETTKFLKDTLGEKFHLLGRGYNEVDDKAEGIDPYAFHLVCENNDIDHFWTEKLADAYLGWAFPVFSGCANIGDYFPEDSYITVNLENPQETRDQIQKLLDDPDFFSARLPAIEHARTLVLDKYNLFAVINDTITGQKWNFDDVLKEPEYIHLQTTKENIFKRAIRKMKTLCAKVIHRLKNLPFLLPIYFKIINKDPDFFTDYYDSLGKKGMTEGYYGQRGQDWFLDQKIFNGKTGGVFLDVGANDPRELSNTLYFEEKGWTGLAFEPQERFRKKWETERKTKCLPHLLGATEGEEVTFIEYDTDDWQNALSGVEGYALETGANLENLDKKRSTLKKRRLDNALEEQNILNIDFMSLDVEGFEMEVLQGIDFKKINIEVIVVENDRSHLGDNTLRNYIKGKGYRHIARLSGDDVFKKVGT